MHQQIQLCKIKAGDHRSQDLIAREREERLCFLPTEDVDLLVIAGRGVAARCAHLPDSTTQAHVPKEDSESEWLKERKSTWAALIKLIYETDPLLCPKCGRQMKIVSVIKDGAVIDKILDHLQYKFAVLPLSARSPPPEAPASNSDFPLDPPVSTEGD